MSLLQLLLASSTSAAATGDIVATGGIISEYTAGGTRYRAHIFTSTGSFDVTSVPGSSPGVVEYLVIAGGGGGGPASGDQVTGGGAGGAGGFRTNVPGHPLAGSSLPISTGSYTITVGGGGAGKLFSPGASSFGARGGDSSFSTITSTGGGGGATADVPGPAWPTGPGGSGGGGGGSSSAGVFGTGNTPPTSPSQGNPGGVGIGPPPFGGGGGGGATAAGNPGPGGGAGGAGSAISIVNGSTPVTYSTGGQGWTGPGNNPITSVDASPVTGNGGPGATNGAASGGNGGSGIVVVRYAISPSASTAKATGGAISFYGGKTIHAFYTSGSFTVTNPTLSSVEYVVVGGGGGSQPNSPNPLGGVGGGGAGGYRTGTAFPVSVPGGPYTITVGAGGSRGANGSSSIFSTITSNGGGYGVANAARFTATAGIPGGSGGGAARYDSTNAVSGGTGNTPPTSPPQGNPGGGVPPGGGGERSGAGGGGAGGAGTPTDTGAAGGPGGVGAQIPATFRDPTASYGTPGPNPGGFYLAGGGGGQGNFGPGPNIGVGGAGGGGNASGIDGLNPSTATDGTTNTGGGAGGFPAGKNGGSGIVIIAYPT